MDAASLEVYATSDFSERKRIILRALSDAECALTDRQIAERLGRDRGEVQPRVSDLIEDGFLCKVGTTQCANTGKRVRLVAIAIPIQQAVL